MRESRTYGSVRGALSNERPYRDPILVKMWFSPAVPPRLKRGERVVTIVGRDAMDAGAQA
jgi:hypothetical protein